MAVESAPSARQTAPQPFRTEVSEGEVARASVALLDLVRARTRLHRLQRDVVLGRGDAAQLDAAVVAYRVARVRAERWLAPAEPGGPSATELFASWLIEAAASPNAQGAPAAA